MKLYVITYSEREHDIIAANEHIAIMSFKEITGNHCRILGIREV